MARLKRVSWSVKPAMEDGPGLVTEVIGLEPSVGLSLECSQMSSSLESGPKAMHRVLMLRTPAFGCRRSDPSSSSGARNRSLRAENFWLFPTCLLKSFFWQGEKKKSFISCNSHRIIQTVVLRCPEWGAFASHPSRRLCLFGRYHLFMARVPTTWMDTSVFP